MAFNNSVGSLNCAAVFFSYFVVLILTNQEALIEDA